MAEPSPDAKEMARLDAEVARLRTLAYVPGLFKCAKCSCSVMSTSMHVTTGQFAANVEPQSCPNGCGPMWPVTERDAGNEMVDRADKAAEEVARMRPVYEAAKAWRVEQIRLKAVIDDHNARLARGEAVSIILHAGLVEPTGAALDAAIDAALAAEPLVATDTTPIDDIRRARVVVSPTGEVLKNAYGRIAEPKEPPIAEAVDAQERRGVIAKLRIRERRQRDVMKDVRKRLDEAAMRDDATVLAFGVGVCVGLLDDALGVKGPTDV